MSDQTLENNETIEIAKEIFMLEECLMMMAISWV